MKRKQIVLVFLIVCILGVLLFIPKTKQKEIKTSTKKKTTISYYHKEYTSTLASQHSILKDQADIIKEFKNYVKQMISNDDIDIEM